MELVRPKQLLNPEAKHGKCFLCTRSSFLGLSALITRICSSKEMQTHPNRAGPFQNAF